MISRGFIFIISAIAIIAALALGGTIFAKIGESALQVELNQFEEKAVLNTEYIPPELPQKGDGSYQTLAPYIHMGNEELEAFVEKNYIPYMILDGGIVSTDNVEAKLKGLENFQGYPTMIIIGKDGKVASVGVGFGPGFEEQISKIVRTLLDKGNEKKSQKLIGQGEHFYFWLQKSPIANAERQGKMD